MKSSTLTAVTTLINASVKAFAIVNSIREAELYKLNYELSRYGHPHFEPTISNARAILAHYQVQTAIDSEFIDIINQNYS